MHVRYEDIGSPLFAGVFPFRASMVEVLFQHIIVWRAYPSAVFEAEWVPGPKRGVLRLMRWSIPSSTIIRFD